MPMGSGRRTFIENVTYPHGSQITQGWLTAFKDTRQESLGCVYSTLKCLIKRKPPNQQWMGHFFCQTLGFLESVRPQASTGMQMESWWICSQRPILSPSRSEMAAAYAGGLKDTKHPLLLKKTSYDTVRTSHTIISCPVHISFSPYARELLATWLIQKLLLLPLNW